MQKLDWKNWSVDRILRVLIGALLIGSGAADEAWWILSIGLVFLYQGITNTGCPGQHCALPEQEEKKNSETL